MLLNKVLFVSLLVMGLCLLQAAYGERLATRLAGGTQATVGQFPFAALIQYSYTDANGNTVIYQGTGVIYNPQIVITSANALNLCASGTVASVFQGVHDLTNTTGAQGTTFTCNVGTTIIQATGFAAGTYFNDFAYIDLSSTGFSFQGNVFLRQPTSSPTADDIGRLYAVGYGETFPGGPPSPVLQYVALNPERNHVCQDKLSIAGISNLASFTENFCVSGFIKSPTSGVLTDACVLDAGAPIIRTRNIGAPYADHEVVGIVNFATCSDSSPVIATYLWKYASADATIGGKGLLPTQTNPPAAGNPVNLRAFDGNFACGDGIVQPGAYEKCDSTNAVFGCCNPYTCQFVEASTPCTVNNRNGTTCRQQPRCNNAGKCLVKFRNQGKTCNGQRTKCNRGQCCTYPGRTNCFI